MNSGLIKTPMTIDHQRSLLDTATCQTFTEVIVTNKEKPYVLGTRLRVNHDKIAKIEVLWTTTGYWLFNADTYLRYSSTEKWNVIPAGTRDPRATLMAAANAYLDAFLEGKMDLVPWGLRCNRTEGGAHTGSGAPDTHLFRVESGKRRDVHTLTHLLQANCQGGRGRAGAAGQSAGSGGQRGETAPTR